jgi:PTH1 family peptidyl-tRNA hydrolase
MWLIVGLGNPGPEYADTYHNVGFRVVERLAERFGTRVGISCGPALISNRVAVGGSAGQEAILVLPQTFMNLSGSVLPKLFERFETSPEKLLTVYDDIALPLGKLRIRQKGSAGGHNGVKSLISSCGSDAFLRVRVGILPERPIERLHDFVLSRVAKRDRELIERSELAAADAVEALLKDGPEKAMATFNRLDLREEERGGTPR